MRNSILIGLCAIIGIRCSGDKKPPAGLTEYKSVRLYCVCFEYRKTDVVKTGISGVPQPCGTDIAVYPASVVSPAYLFDSASNANIMNSLKRIIFTERDQNAEIERSRPDDSRFLILFQTDEAHADTLVYLFPNKLLLNSNYLFTYSFDVMDSIRRTIGKEKIDCMDN